MSAKNFLDLLEQKGLLAGSVIAELRQQVADKKASAEAIAKVLVERGQLTKFQATKLVGEATADSEQKREGESARKSSGDDDLGLAPLDDDEAEEESSPPATGRREQEEEVVMLQAAEEDEEEAEEVAGLTPVEDAGAALTPVAPPRAQGLTPLGDALGGAAAGDSGGLDAFDNGATQVRLPTTPKLRRNVWDTKLMFGGALGLLLLLIAGFFLAWNLLQTPADELWKQAMEDYRSGSYTQAEARFDKFLNRHSKDERASEARVRIVLCKIRVVLSDPQKGLDRATELLPTIESETAFSVARDELATMLIQIPQGFLKKAKLTSDMAQKEELVALAEQGMELVNNPSYVPTSKRQDVQKDINEANEDINLVYRDINQDKDLAAAIAGIAAATQADETLRAYQIYKDLINVYPGLAHDAGLKEALLEVTQRERSLVRVSEEAMASVSEEAASASEYRVVLASRAGDGAPQVANLVASVLAAGSVYGLDAETGAPLWGRFVGHGAALHPVRTSNQADADVLLVDGVRHELVRVAARSGDLVWRLPVGEPMWAPVVGADRIYVTALSGRLLEVDAQTGVSPRQASTPLPLYVPAAEARDRRQLFQIAEHSNLYVLSTDSLQCTNVHYLGHKAGTVAVPPLVHMSHIFVAENFASDRSRLHILRLKTEEDGGSVETPQEAISLKGNVVVPLVPYGRRLLVATDLGEVGVYDINLNKDPPVSEAAFMPATLTRPLAGYPLTDASSLWLADDRLTKYRIQVTTAKIDRQEIVNVGDTFTGPLQLLGDVLIHSRRRKGSVGVTVEAVNIDAPRQSLWQTDLGVPASRVNVDAENRRVHVISAAAALFEITAEAFSNGYSDQPQLTARSATGTLSFTDQIEFADGRVALFNPAEQSQLLLYDPSGTANRLRFTTLQLPEGEVTCVPAAFQGGLLVPSDSGQVLLLDPVSGGNQLLPFQPKLEPGDRIAWRRPAVLGDTGDEFVIVDDRQNIYRIGIKPQPQPFLEALARARLDVDVDSPLAAAGDTVYGVVRAGGSDVVVAINAQDLKVVQEWDLGGRVSWGPQLVGDAVLVVSGVDAQQLRVFESGAKLRWEQPAPMQDRVVGLPLVDGGDFIFAGLSGAVWRISGQTGQQTNKSEVGEPLGNGPVAFGARLLLCGNDGSLHVIPMLAGS